MGEGLVDESNRLEKVFWRCWQAAGIVDLTGEIPMGEELKLGYIKVFSELVCLCMNQKQSGRLVYMLW